MPLMQGKSEKAFDRNVSTEMHSGRPQKQALAIAYAIKRKMAQKKAKGGIIHEDKIQEKDSSGFPVIKSPGTFNEDARRVFIAKKANGGMIQNEDLSPTFEPEQEAEDEMMRQHDFSKRAQEHEELEEPQESTESVMPDEEDEPHGMRGNIVEAIMASRMGRSGHYPKDYPTLPERMAEGGMVKKYPNQDYVYARDKGEMGTADRSIRNKGTDNLTYIDDHRDDDFLSDEEQTPYFHPNEMDDDESSPRRSRIIEKIMRGLEKRYLG